MLNVKVLCECSNMSAQLDNLLELATLRFPDGLPDEFVGKLFQLSCDVLITECVSAIDADGSCKVRCILGWGASFECLTAALRTNELRDGVH